ncbi:sensor histidine kinase [Candidatus Tokpelaia sp.]|uniref:sensor histidine kinase n=1 Tax=Candidatus Tokpelaia sp. TaxID=2233777 RepID=UPI003CC7DE74
MPLLMALRSADICVLYQTPDLLYTMAENLPPVLKAGWRPFCRDSDIFPPAAAAQMENVKKRLLAGGQTARLEFSLSPKPAGQMAGAENQSNFAAGPGSLAPGLAGERMPESSNDGHGSQALWYKFFIEAHCDAQGKILGLVTSGVNISELRAREEVLKILLREVSHRSKNLLAIIQSIATQTARFCHNIGSFLKKFQGRLHSLSSSQDLVTDSDWRGALLQDLVFAQLRFYTESITDKQHCSISVQGENPYLFPSAALHIGLALHELIINSAAFGVLALGRGKIAVNCRAEGEEESPLPAAAALAGSMAAVNRVPAGGKALILSWREDFPAEAAESMPPAAAGSEQGNRAGGKAAAGDFMTEARFGSIMLERIVPQSVDGAAHYSIKNGRVEYFLKIPVAQFA